MSNVDRYIDAEYEVVAKKAKGRGGVPQRPEFDKATMLQIQNLPSFPWLQGKLGKAMVNNAVDHVREVGAINLDLTQNQGKQLVEEARGQLERLEKHNVFLLDRDMAYYRSKMNEITQFVLDHEAKCKKGTMDAIKALEMQVRKEINAEIFEFSEFNQAERNKIAASQLDEDMKQILSIQLGNMYADFMIRMQELIDGYMKITKKLIKESEVS